MEKNAGPWMGAHCDFKNKNLIKTDCLAALGVMERKNYNKMPGMALLLGKACFPLVGTV